MNEEEARLWIGAAQHRGLPVGPRQYEDRKFSKQDAFVKDKSKFLAAQCSRRAGKSNGLGIRFFNTLENHPNCFCPYVALTRPSAENIMWPVLQELDDKFKIGMTFNVSDLTMHHPNGARLQLFGADMKNFINRLKGIKTPGAAVDEVQNFGDHIESLVDDVLTPALADYKDSWLAITGTPGPIPRGYFYEITEKKRFGFSLHKWTVLDNPYLPDAETFIKDLILKKGWESNHPTLLREWRNQWVLDVESLLIKYDEDKNHYDSLPPSAYNYILGIDLGIKDSDALAVIAWSDSSRKTYLVEELVTSGQGISELADQIGMLKSKYPFSKMVCDEGALGKKIAEELRRRFHLPILPADKQRKMENVAFLNDDLRLGKFMAKRDSIFAQDSYKVQIDYERSGPERLVVKDSFHSDIIDAVLYAFKESPSWTYKEPVPKPKYGTKEWADKEVEEMERAAEEYFKKQEELSGEFGFE